MCNLHASAAPLSVTAALSSAALLLFLLHLLPPVSAKESPTPWLTLHGDPPLVIARGGFSGLFPYGSRNAFEFTISASVPDVILWCDVQLTKDGAGICLPDVSMQNHTTIAEAFPERRSTYPVDGVPTTGYFTVDFTYSELSNVLLLQAIYSRTAKFDGALAIHTVEELAGLNPPPPGLWLNIQRNAFFAQHNLSMESYVLSVSQTVRVNYISSPEVGFLRSIAAKFNPKTTKLVFHLLGPDDVEPSTKKTYSSLLTNLTFIKTFASGIIIPKTYIWPQDKDSYLLPHTSVVLDAHKAGLQVFASEFYNDFSLSYNYSYDPVVEYLNFIDNGNFSIDGMLSDFPITPSAARECFSHIGKNATEQANFLIISKDGASGDYPGCTDLAYENAISDGADIIDCPVQLSKDRVPFCSGSINLMNNTNVAQTSFSKLQQSIPELGSGIFAFSLTRDQIQNLTPAISNIYSNFELKRNPKFKFAGKLQTLAGFLALAKNRTSLSGVSISIENAAYLMEKQSLPVIDVVLDVLSRAGYDNQTGKRVMIQSTDSSVLKNLREKNNYELVYEVDETIRDVLDDTVKEIKTFADSVVVDKKSVFPVSSQFLIGTTNVVSRLQSSGLSVYVKTFSNEFVSQPWDCFSDPTVEINTFYQSENISGVITDFPQTSARYRKNRCLSAETLPVWMASVEPGALMQIIPSFSLPPAAAPSPMLTVSDVEEPPLPTVSAIAPAPNPDGGKGAAPTPRNVQPKISACVFLANLAVLFTFLCLS